MLKKGILRKGSVNWGSRTSGDWKLYTERKADWIRTHPEASYRDIDKAAKAIAKELGL